MGNVLNRPSIDRLDFQAIVISSCDRVHILCVLTCRFHDDDWRWWSIIILKALIISFKLFHFPFFQATMYHSTGYNRSINVTDPSTHKASRILLLR